MNSGSDRLHELIPGGAHTYSKGDDQFPANAPSRIESGHGAHVRGSDGEEYLDLCMGLTSVILGHAYEPVNRAVRASLKNGVNFQRPSDVELQFAEYLNDLFPWLDMFKFAKNGSSCTTAAVKLARAYTGRDRVAVCGDHPFFSYDDWFIGSTEVNRGIPEEYRQHTLRFPYGDLDATRTLFEEHPGEIAALILEPVRFEPPPDGYLDDLKSLCHEHGALFVLDEIITGFKHDVRGAQSVYGVEPDLTTFGKSIANGFSVDVLAGRRDVMRLGGIRHDEERVFLLSTTNGAETLGLSAALATLREIRERDVVNRRKSLGQELMDRLNDLFTSRGLDDHLVAEGFPALPLVQALGPEGTPSLAFKTLLCQEVIERGVLFQGLLTLCYEHTREDLNRILEAFDGACDRYREALDAGEAESFVRGHLIKPVFRKYN